MATIAGLALTVVAAPAAFAEPGTQATATAGTQQQQRQQQGQQSQAHAVVVGSLIDKRDLALSGEQESHQILKLETAAGATVLVDVGAQQSAQAPEIEEGQRVMAIGNKGRIGDKPVLFARYYGPVYDGGKLQDSESEQTSVSGAR